MKNQEMSRVEALKTLHTIEALFSKNSWYYHFNQVFKIHKTYQKATKALFRRL